MRNGKKCRDCRISLSPVISIFLYISVILSDHDGDYIFSFQKAEQESGYVPLPIVHLIQDPECDATTVEISFGDRLGLLIDTVNSLNTIPTLCSVHMHANVHMHVSLFASI